MPGSKSDHKLKLTECPIAAPSNEEYITNYGPLNPKGVGLRGARSRLDVKIGKTRSSVGDRTNEKIKDGRKVDLSGA